ncbi:tRNA-splicing endonuclease subunit Sen15 [Vespula squamosa]|uniref:tRNA-splicing endonuclease subunit Sen15 n=1 Tax=Vespula squamosa TaxID=30214 RepID=A0ABD1ZYK4_VESSQ
MYDICHPSFYYIGKLGCNDPIKISNAFYIYMQLCEDKRFWHIDYKYNQELDLLYLEIKKNKNSNLEIYVPWPISFSITIDFIEKIQKVLETDRLIFAFKSADSTSVFYRASAGLIKPISPEIRKQLKEKEDKKILLERNIKKNTSNLYELAKSIKTENSNLQSKDTIENKNEETNSETTSITGI